MSTPVVVAVVAVRLRGPLRRRDDSLMGSDLRELAARWADALGDPVQVTVSGRSTLDVVLPGTDLNQARLVIARLRSGLPPHLSLRTGLARVLPDESLDAARERAAAAVVAARSRGRWSVVVAAAEPPRHLRVAPAPEDG